MKIRFLPLLLSVLVFSVLFTTSCRKKVHKVNEDYIGFWEGEDAASVYTFIIQDDSEADYEKNTGGVYVSFAGALRLRNDRMRIARIKAFDVDQHPTPTGNGTEWSMIIDGITYYCEK